jgi:hypothetical protein
MDIAIYFSSAPDWHLEPTAFLTPIKRVWQLHAKGVSENNHYGTINKQRAK